MAERLDRRFEIGLFTLDNRHIRLAPRERLLDHVSVRVGRAKFSERPVGADVSHRPLGLADNSGEPRGVVAAAKADDVAGVGVVVDLVSRFPCVSDQIRVGPAQVEHRPRDRPGRIRVGPLRLVGAEFDEQRRDGRVRRAVVSALDPTSYPSGACAASASTTRFSAPGAARASVSGSPPYGAGPKFPVT